MWGDQGGLNQGGGFDQGGGFNSPGGFGTPQASEERKGRSRAQNCAPVTVAQILNATHNDDRFYSGKLEISQVTLIGLIRTVKESTTRLDYELDDMTGPPLEIKQFVDNDENIPDEERVPTMRENTYVRVYGHVRSFSGKKNVVAFKVQPVTDMNELTCHILDVIYSHASVSKESAAEVGGRTSTAAVGPSHNENAGNYGLSSLNKQVATVIRNSNSDLGISISEVARHLKGAPEKAIREAVEFLSSEGHIYSTIDDDHFKATDG